MLLCSKTPPQKPAKRVAPCYLDHCGESRFFLPPQYHESFVIVVLATAEFSHTLQKFFSQYFRAFDGALASPFQKLCPSEILPTCVPGICDAIRIQHQEIRSPQHHNRLTIVRTRNQSDRQPKGLPRHAVASSSQPQACCEAWYHRGGKWPALLNARCPVIRLKLRTIAVAYWPPP